MDAGRLTVTMDAGTAQLFVDIDKANTKLRDFGKAAQEAGGHTVSSMQASSAAIRMLENPLGNNVRAVERFLTLIPGVGSLLQVAFPIVGALALVNVVKEAIDKAVGLKEALEGLKKATADLNAEDAKLNTTTDSIAVQKLTELFGPAAGLKQKANQEAADAQDALLRAKNLRAEAKMLADNFNRTALLTDAVDGIPGINIRQANKAAIDAKEAEAKKAEDEAQALAAQAEKSRFDMERDSVKDSAGLSVERIDNLIKANAAGATLARELAQIQIASEHAVRQAQIDGIQDALTRDVASAQERVRVALATRDALNKIEHDTTQLHIAQIRAKAAAESQGKTPVQAQGIQIKAQGEISGLNSAQYLSETKLQGDFVKAEGAYDEAVATMQRSLTEDLVKEAQKRAAAINEEMNHLLEQAARIGEIQAKGTGETDALKVEGQKLSYERAYDQQLSHTAAQQIAHADRLAEYDADSRARKIADLQVEEQIALYDVGSENHLVKAAQIQQSINALKAEDANKTIEADTAHAAAIDKQNSALQAQKTIAQAIADWQHIGPGTFAQDAANTAVALPGQLGGALASGIFGNGKKGEDVGKQVGDALKNAGKQLFGQVLTQALEKLIATLLGQGVFQTANTTAVGSLTAAIVANTAAVTASGASSAAEGAAGGIGAAAGGVANAAGSATSSFLSGLMGPLIAAAGGVVGGVISGLMAEAGDTRIVNAVNGTTAAVMSLRGNLGAAVSTNGTTPSTTAATTPASGSGSGALGFLQSFFGIGGSQPIPVSIVSVSPLSPLSGLFHLFAKGGRPSPGMPYVVGENGPEIRVDDSPGTIFPSTSDYMRVGGGASSGGNNQTSMSSGGHTMHFHVYGNNNPRESARQIANFLKSTSPTFAPASR